MWNYIKKINKKKTDKSTEFWTSLGSDAKKKLLFEMKVHIATSNNI